MNKLIAIILLAFCVVPRLAYCDATTWTIDATKQDLDYINKFNNSLPICIQDSFPQDLYIKIIDNDLKNYEQVCGDSFEFRDGLRIIIIALHLKSHPGACEFHEIYAHELGHHYNWFVGVSDDPNFITAFRQDWKLIPSKFKIHNKTWLHDPEEVAAELFALEFMGSKDYYASLSSHPMYMFPKSKFIFEQHLCTMPTPNNTVNTKQ